MMFAKNLLFLLFGVGSIVTIDGVINLKKFRNNDECGATDLSVFGRNVHHGQWPFVALIYYVNNDRIHFVCSGTIISKFAVITAAHCLKNKGENKARRTEDIKIRLGAYNLLNFIERESLYLTPNRVILHPDWNSFNENFDADVAILMMSRVIEFSQFIKPICLFHSTDLVTEINDGWLVGYEITSDHYHFSPRKLRIPIVDTRTCLQQEPRYTRLVSPRTFCAGSKSSANVCRSFLGSGLFVFHNGRFFLAGIASVSFSDSYRECDLSNLVVFSNIHLMADWIHEILKQKPVEITSKEFGNHNLQTTTEETRSTVIQEENFDVRLSNEEKTIGSLATNSPKNFLTTTEIPFVFEYPGMTKSPGSSKLPGKNGYSKNQKLPGVTESSRNPKLPGFSETPKNPENSRFPEFPKIPEIPRIPESQNPNSSSIVFPDYSFEDSFEPSFDPNSGFIPTSPPPPAPPSTKAPSRFARADCGVMIEGNGLVQGGSKAKAGQFPWAAAVFRKNSLRGNIVDYAIGALISYRHVYIEALTISFINDKRVIFNPKPNEIRVLLGFDDLSLVTDDSPFSEVSDLIIHPDYILGLPIKANVAVIILRDPVEFTRHVFPVCLWDSPINLSDEIGKTIYSFGYGGQNTESTTKLKKFTAAKIKDQSECPTDYKFILRNVKDKSPYFCAGGDRNETICVGDSAAAYVKRDNLWFLYATVAYHDISINTKICNANKPIMFEFLTGYVKWIQNIVITM